MLSFRKFFRDLMILLLNFSPIFIADTDLHGDFTTKGPLSSKIAGRIASRFWVHALAHRKLAAIRRRNPDHQPPWGFHQCCSRDIAYEISHFWWEGSHIPSIIQKVRNAPLRFPLLQPDSRSSVSKRRAVSCGSIRPFFFLLECMILSLKWESKIWIAHGSAFSEVRSGGGLVILKVPSPVISDYYHSMMNAKHNDQIMT